MPDLQLLNIQAGRLQARPDFEMTFNGAGRFASGPTFITGIQVAVQDAIRGLLTLITTNRLAPSFGTSIVDLINSRSVEEISGLLSREVRNVIGYIAQLRAEDDSTEQIVEIIDLTAIQNERKVEISLTVRTGSGEATTVTVS